MGEAAPRQTPATSGEPVLNAIWLALVLISVLHAAFTGRMAEVSKASLEGAKNAIELVIGLIGAMMFFLGLMRVATEGGLLVAVARVLSPLLRRLFPEVPAEHPAMIAMIMNLASNVLGLGNAATPFGLKAMQEFDRLNPRPGVATDSMILFLAINATSVTLFPPLGTIAVRFAAGSQHPEAIWVPTLIATTCSTAVAVVVCLLYRRFGRPAEGLADGAAPTQSQSFHAVELPDLAAARPRASTGARIVIAASVLALGAAFALELARALPGGGLADLGRRFASDWLLPLLIAALLLVGLAGRVKVYDAVIAGAREALQIATAIAPYMVAILVAVAMFRASGALDLLVGAVDPLTRSIGVPAEALPMVFLRPLSGSGSFAVMSEILTTHGPDTFVGYLTSTLQGSTETTFYVLALYFGAARVREGRYALTACLMGDLAGFLGAVAACHWFFPQSP
jgi:spore maturation protein SpmA